MVQSHASVADEPPETVEDWFRASLETRAKALSHSLERIRQTDPSIQAWVQVLPQLQLEDGPLSGIPFGVKDTIDTRNLVTEYGSPIYKGCHAQEDAAVVRRLQASGAILLGKTQAAAFAYRTPAPTRNPWDLDRTPGGSSSGSAAAVAAGMAPLAIGTQTLGSVLRPASYCGVTGFKPSFGLLPMQGVLPMADSLDTLGFFMHTPAGMLMLWEALGEPIGEQEGLVLGVPEPLPDIDPEMSTAFRDTVSHLRQHGLVIEPLSIAPMLDKLAEEALVVMFYEGARFHEPRFRQHGDRLLDLANLVLDGLQISDQRYRQALAFIAESKEWITERYRTTPVILTPAATGPAPRGLASTGDARMNSPWTALGTPAISIPMQVSNGLPMGIQLTAAHGQDARLLRTAVRLAGLLAGT